MKADVDRCHPWMVERPRLLPGLEMGVLAPRDVIWKKRKYTLHSYSNLNTKGIFETH